jgi:glyoxalase family protein
VTIWEDGDSGSAELLSGMMGMREAGEEGNRLRFETSADGVGSVVDLRRSPGFWRGDGGVGTVHHVAFRAASDAEQLDKRRNIEAAGIGITPVVDRQYFKSVYFYEPGGVLFEIATDGPGFMIDESPGDLGSRLQLPPALLPMREQIERALPPLRSREIGLATT